MEYKDDTGTYEISYSQRLQKEDMRLKRIMIGLLLAGLLFMALIFIMLAIIQFNGGHLGFILKNLVCR
jgi:pilus assembly protein TadC